MSTASTLEDDGWLVDGPSVARAFLRALALRLHRLALAARHAASRIVGGLREISWLVIDTTLTTIAVVRTRSGLTAAVSLVLAVGRVAAHALHALAIRASAMAGQAVARVRQVIGSLPAPHLPKEWTSRTLEVAKSPRAAGVLLAVAVVLAGAAILRRLSRRPRDAEILTPPSLTQEELERVMQGLYVVLGTDGSIRVHGIPATSSDTVREELARVAASAATQRLESLVRRGRPLSTLDLQAVNVAARSAVARQFSSTTDVDQVPVHVT